MTNLEHCFSLATSPVEPRQALFNNRVMPLDEESDVLHALYTMPAPPDQSSLDPVTLNQLLMHL